MKGIADSQMENLSCFVFVSQKENFLSMYWSVFKDWNLKKAGSLEIFRLNENQLHIYGFFL